MTKAESDALLAKEFWNRDGSGGFYRVPLPTTDKFPRYRWSKRLRDGRTQSEHRLAGVSVPPYLTAFESFEGDEGIEVMLCFGSCYRANTSGIPTDPEASPDNEWVYADGDNVPEEWREPIEAAIQDVRSIWPQRTVRFRPLRILNAETVNA